MTDSRSFRLLTNLAMPRVALVRWCGFVVISAHARPCVNIGQENGPLVFCLLSARQLVQLLCDVRKHCPEFRPVESSVFHADRHLVRIRTLQCGQIESRITVAHEMHLTPRWIASE